MNNTGSTVSLTHAAARADSFSRFPRLALRRRAADHPMGLFGLAAAGAILSISVASHQPTSVAFEPRVAPAMRDVAAAKGDRLQPTRTELACAGQAWGSEDADCLVAIAKDGGKTQSARIRTISGA